MMFLKHSFSLGSLIILSHGSPLISLNSSFSICQFCLPINVGIPLELCTWNSISIPFEAISTIFAILTITYMHDSQVSHLLTFSYKLQTLTNTAHRRPFRCPTGNFNSQDTKGIYYYPSRITPSLAQLYTN